MLEHRLDSSWSIVRGSIFDDEFSRGPDAGGPEGLTLSLMPPLLSSSTLVFRLVNCDFGHPKSLGLVAAGKSTAVLLAGHGVKVMVSTRADPRQTVLA